MFDDIPYFPDFIGALGATIVLIAYVMLQTRKMKAESFLYSFLNMISSFMILFSLVFSWNLGAALTESAWLLVSIYGIFKGYSSAQLNDDTEE